ncbi:hypothetical protein I317_03784 [Kwoniella heveanensis CBS 569]|nr:hypothetical protein I317_03784 [Kwoniella heveanensis CBS 569]
MSSPFPIPNLGSSPFPFSLPQIAQPSPQTQPLAGGTGTGTGSTPAPFFAPSPLSQLISSSISSLPVGLGSTSSGFTPSIAASLQQNPLGSNSSINGNGIGVVTGTATGTGVSPAFQGITPNTSALLAAVGVTPSQVGSIALGPNHSNINFNLNAIPSAQAQIHNQNQDQSQSQSQSGAQTTGGAAGYGGGKKQEIGLEQMIRSMSDTETLLARAEVVLGEIKEVEGRVFEGTKEGDGERLLDLALHTEYGQLIQTALLLSQSSLFGALPVLPMDGSSTTSTSDLNANATVAPLGTTSSDPATQAEIEMINPTSGGITADQSTAPAPAAVAATASTGSGSGVTMADLINWAEQRAALEFGRREALKAGAKAVVDILKASASASASASAGAGVGVGGNTNVGAATGSAR